MIRDMSRFRIFVTCVFLALALVACGMSATVTTPSAKQVVIRLRGAGLPIGTYRVYSEVTDPNKLLGRPGQYLGKVNFQDRRVKASERLSRFDVSAGGSVEVFGDRGDAHGGSNTSRR
jgi:hypothetical protein